MTISDLLFAATSYIAANAVTTTVAASIHKSVYTWRELRIFMFASLPLFIIEEVTRFRRRRRERLQRCRESDAGPPSRRS